MSADALTSTARVATNRPARYGKQLAAHMGRRVPFEWDEATQAGTVTFGEGSVRAALRAAPGTLVMELAGPATELDRYEEVLGSHLVRFGVRDRLHCAWVRGDGSEGTVQTADSDG